MKLNIKIITRGQINIPVSVSDQYRRKAIQLMNTGIIYFKSRQYLQSQTWTTQNSWYKNTVKILTKCLRPFVYKRTNPTLILILLVYVTLSHRIVSYRTYMYHIIDHIVSWSSVSYRIVAGRVFWHYLY